MALRYANYLLLIIVSLSSFVELRLEDIGKFRNLLPDEIEQKTSIAHGAAAYSSGLLRNMRMMGSYGEQHRDFPCFMRLETLRAQRLKNYL